MELFLKVAGFIFGFVAMLVIAWAVFQIWVAARKDGFF